LRYLIKDLMHNLRTRLRIDAALLALAEVLLLAVFLPILAPVRPGVALAACVLLPGAAVLTLAPVDSLLTWCLVSVLLSLSIETISSLLILWLHIWHPAVLAVVLGSLSVALLGRDLYRTARLLPVVPPDVGNWAAR